MARHESPSPSQRLSLQEQKTQLLRTFAERFASTSLAQVVVVRAPGRVNLIGEHVDYSGFGVLPMAIENAAWVVVAFNGSNVGDPEAIRVANVESDKWSSRTYTSIDEPLDRENRHWTHYVLAGIKGLYQRIDEGSAASQLQSRGFDILVYSDVPPGSGLSSSSALLCASALSIVHLFSLAEAFPPASLGELCARAEQYVGSESGGMDQAISFLALEGVAKHILFDPLRSQDVALPRGCSWVLVNSMTSHSVADGGGYNMRVSECRLAAALLAKHLGYASLLEPRSPDAKHPKIRLIEVVQRLAEDSHGSFDPDSDLSDQLMALSDIASTVLGQPSYTLSEMAALLEVSPCQVKANFVAARLHDGAETLHYKLAQRVRHVFEESSRVYQFKSTLASGSSSDQVLTSLGQLLSASHTSCRDLFECSCPELDDTVAASLKAGALGSRLTAGWGGWTVSLVPNSLVPHFVQELSIQHSVLVSGAAPGASRVLF